MSAKLRGAVVGCGMIAEIHLRAWSRLPEVEIVALGDRDVTAAERRRELAPGAAVYTDLQTLLRQARPDVTTFTRVHVDIAITGADDARAAALVEGFRRR